MGECWANQVIIAHKGPKDAAPSRLDSAASRGNDAVSMARRDPAAPNPADANITRISTDPQKFSYSAPLGRKGLLVVMSRDAFGVSFVIDQPSIVLGRQKDCEFAIDDPLLSRRHSLITGDEQGDFSIEDLNSTNGTFLNSRKVQKKSRLQYGDRIVLGNTILRFYLEEELGKK